MFFKDDIFITNFKMLLFSNFMKKLFLYFLLLFSLNVFCQENISFQKPSAEILQLADFQRPPSVLISPDKKWIVSVYRNTYKSLSELNQPEMRLAGLRMNPLTNSGSTTVYFKNLTVRGLKESAEKAIKGLPQAAKIAFISFSPDSKKLAFTNSSEKGVELWIVNLETAEATKLTADDLNANMGSPYSWYRNSQNLLISKLPADRSQLLDANKDLPSGPIVSTSGGQVSQLRTYQDLLKNPLDEANFETLTQAELYTVNLQGVQSKLINAAIYTQRSFSPDGNYLLITRIKRPFSYVVPLNSFPQESIVYTINSKEFKVVNEVPLNEIQPKGFSSTRKGKRHMHWRSDKPATLAYVVALDEGDAAKKVDFRDEVFTWDAPFEAEPSSLTKIADRFNDIVWGDRSHALVYSSWYDTRKETIFVINPETKESRLLAERNSQDIYSDLGSVHQEKNEFGIDVMYVSNNKTYWIGDGYTKEGQFPFIEEVDMQTFKMKRLYTAKSSGTKEDIASIIDVKKGDILVSIQSPTDYPNYFAKNFKSGKSFAVTAFENPFKGLEGVHKEVINYKRKDGVDLSGTLYLPAGYDKKEKLPLLIWAYPTEYKDKATAGQSTANPNEFTYPSYGSFIYWVTKGYAVLDDAAFPIIGEGEKEPNDSFIEQLVSNAQAAIDAIDVLGYVDRKRVAVGGHSYGAFMTANLLTHSNLFVAGIARSGAYNRTLTPFGFQREQRNYWEVPQIYNSMSPFMNADKMKTPMLLIHGAADNNPGTFTLQTERYFQALKNLGAPVRMVLLPFESHGYSSSENIFHTLWEQDQFLEKYVKEKK